MLKRHDKTTNSWVDAEIAKRHDKTTNSWVDVQSVKTYDSATQSWVEKMYKYFAVSNSKLKDTSSYSILDNGISASLDANMSDNDDFVEFSVMGLNLQNPTVKFNFEKVRNYPKVYFDVYTGPTTSLADIVLSESQAYEQNFNGYTIYGFKLTFSTSLGQGFLDSISNEGKVTDFTAGGIKFRFQE